MNKKLRIFLPTEIANVLDNKIEDVTSRVKAYRFMNIVLDKMEMDGLDYGSRVMIPSIYFNRFMKDYSKVLKNLIDIGVITVINSYSNATKNSYTKSYIVNKTLAPSPLLPYMLPETILNHCKSVDYVVRKSNTKKSENIYEFNTISNLKKLNIDEVCLVEKLKERINRFSMNDIKLNSKISGNFFEVLLKGVKYNMSREKIEEICKSDGTSFIQYKSRFFIDDVQNFINKRKTAILSSGLTAIYKLIDGDLFSKRNITNNRLDSNITNMPKDIVNCLCKENNLVQLDLNNSQFSILCHLMGNDLKKDDFKLFKELSFSGELYDYLKRETGLKSRNEAKILMFEVLFAKENSKNPLKSKLVELFPTVISFVDNYKKDNGYSRFSVMLQKKESDIFIDGLFKEMIKRNKFCLTKHDSLIVKKEDLVFTQELIKKYFKKIKFLGKISIE